MSHGHKEKDYINPLDFDEDKGKWSWPPTFRPVPETGKPFRVYPSRLHYWEEIIKELVEGEVVDKSGGATGKLQDRMHTDFSGSNVVSNLIVLETLGLVERDVNGRRTSRIALAVPVDQLPDRLLPKRSSLDRLDEIQAKRDAALPAHVVKVDRVTGFAADDQPADVGDAEAIEAATLAAQGQAIPEMVEMFERAGPEAVDEASADDIAASLVAMLTGGGDTAELDQLREAHGRLEKLYATTAESLRQFRHDNEKLLANQKDLRHRLDESEHKRRQLERNLQAALQAARDLAEQVGIPQREAAQRRTEQMMQNRDRP